MPEFCSDAHRIVASTSRNDRNASSTQIPGTSPPIRSQFRFKPYGCAAVVRYFAISYSILHQLTKYKSASIKETEDSESSYSNQNNECSDSDRNMGTNHCRPLDCPTGFAISLEDIRPPFTRLGSPRALVWNSVSRYVLSLCPLPVLIRDV